MSPRRGSGFADATTIRSWSIFATIVLSTRAASSTVLLSELVRSLTVTIRASEPSTPVTSPTISTKSPTTTDFGPSSRAFIAVTTVPSSVTHVVLPRSTVVTKAVIESKCDGRSFVRRRVVREGRMRASDSSYSRGLIEPNYSRVLGNLSESYELLLHSQSRYQGRLNQ
ncbi:unannotated protein [freshwater metagenome]|uniref:Unannotated protein n=1 Tax=freshwater metagenome TaxID=449393 RepID=A0A6J6AE38_9ZZZZ